MSNDDLATPPCLSLAPPIVDRMTSHVGGFRKLFVLSTDLLEMSQSKKLLTVYSDVVARIYCVLNWEIPELQVRGGI